MPLKPQTVGDMLKDSTRLASASKQASNATIHIVCKNIAYKNHRLKFPKFFKSCWGSFIPNDIFQMVCFNDTHRKRLVFHSIQYRNDWLAASNLFHMFTKLIKFYTFHYQYRCLENVIHQIDSKNVWLLLSAIYGKIFG